MALQDVKTLDNTDYKNLYEAMVQSKEDLKQKFLKHRELNNPTFYYDLTEYLNVRTGKGTDENN